MSDTYWTFPQFPENDDDRIRYLCWRAIGENRERSLEFATNGYMPASWAMLYNPEEAFNV